MLPPKSSAFPTSFQIVVFTENETPDGPCTIRASTHPIHRHIDLYLTAFERLAPLLKLPEGGVRVIAHVGRNEIAFTPRLPSPPLTRFLSQLAMVGASDLAEVRRQVEGYPYERIAEEYERLIREAKRTRRVMPTLAIDTSLLLPLTVADVLGGPSTTIHLSAQRDTIRLRGVPFNQPFARLANEHIMKNAKAAIKTRLPIVGKLRHVARK